MLPYLFPSRFSQWLGPLIAAAIGALLIAVIVVVTGIVDLSAAKPHPEGWARFLHYTFDRSTAFHAGPKPPADLDSPIRIAAGAAYYGQVCARCHGGPGFGQNPVVLSMHPRPQYLATDLPIANFSSPELFRIVKAGVKYSAMPSWPADRRDDEIWQLVAFLRALPKMSPETFRQLAVVSQDQAVSPVPFGQKPAQRAYALRNDDEPPRVSYNYRTPVFGFSGYALSANPAATCARCHGADGAGGGAFPNLTLQSPDYLARTLTAYAAGRRRSGFMQMVATELSPAQIDALAHHYAALPRRSSEAGATAPALGQQIALQGVPSAGLAPCASCHGVTLAASKAYPLLEGEAHWYLANQMRVFRSGGRGSIVGDKIEDPMVAIARKLDDRQIEAVAGYYAAQPPAKVQSFAAVEPKR
ncbi:cytochrome c553 [Sphingomonas vulcanisoli]|uniref:Cytochrome c553 n=1 Tax=Sphingomonas vulcanisoli TaxID=1658060 RepID=A0ABX0TUR1_9SPHN|nr:c-type cytochrome [Sphingomonas vulcanisoli]NIJ08444.1 cytochrome c553 [Sphingomonas vulcanisoli]